MPRTYVDNAYNRSVGRAGLPVGSAVISKNTVCGMNTKTYVDNAYNRQLGRVGMSHGSAVVSKYSDGLTTWNYLDTDKRDRQVGQPGIKSSFTPKYTKQTSEPCKDVKHAWRESDIACLYPQDLPRNRAKDGDIHELVKCRICHTDMDSSSLTSCGHHFCTNCILQRLKRKQSCPFCRTRLRESNLTEDKEFDRIIGHFARRPLRTTDTGGSIRNQEIGQYKQEIKQLKTQIQELKDELDKVRKKNMALRKQTDTNVRQCDDRLQELNEFKQNVLREKDRMIAQLRNQLKERTTESSDTEQAVRILKNEIGQQEYRMKEYEKLCTEKDEELTVLRKFVIPERESIIFQLQRQCKELSARTHELERKYQLERTLSEE